MESVNCSVASLTMWAVAISPHDVCVCKLMALEDLRKAAGKKSSIYFWNSIGDFESQSRRLQFHPVAQTSFTTISCPMIRCQMSDDFVSHLNLLLLLGDIRQQIMSKETRRKKYLWYFPWQLNIKCQFDVFIFLSFQRHFTVRRTFAQKC